MYGPPRPAFHPMRWGYQHPQQRPVWGHSVGPRVQFHGQHQRFSRPNISQPNFDNHWCETCDRGFPTEDILNKHKQQHQKCNIDGCQFIAHPKVITKHIQMQHSTGLYKKIANLKNPEDIEKWREERRKKYPTKANIDKKAAELKEKIDRGEKMGLERNKQYGRKPTSDSNNKPDQGVKRKFGARHENIPRSKLKKYNPTENNDKKHQTTNTNQKSNTPKIEENNKLKPFRGILGLLAEINNEIENESVEINGIIIDEDDSEVLKETNLEKTSDSNEPVVCGALASLICEYGSSEEEDDPKCNKHFDSNLKQCPNPVISNLNAVDVLKCHSKETNKQFANNVVTQDNKEVKCGGQKINETSKREDKNSLKDAELISNSISNIEIPAQNNGEIVQKESICTEITGNTKCKEPIKHKNLEQTQDNNDSDSGPEEIKVEMRKEDITIIEQSKHLNARKSIPKKKVQIDHHRKRKLPSTLLQKLLHKEMKQERNIVLQCIRYITRNHYFDKKE